MFFNYTSTFIRIINHYIHSYTTVYVIPNSPANLVFTFITSVISNEIEESSTTLVGELRPCLETDKLLLWEKNLQNSLLVLEGYNPVPLLWNLELDELSNRLTYLGHNVVEHHMQDALDLASKWAEDDGLKISSQKSFL